MSNRRKTRETVVQGLYSWKIGNQHPEDVLRHVLRPGLKDDTLSLRFAEQLLLATIDHAPEIEPIVASHTANWEVDRLAVLDRLVLYMAITEILHFEDIPTKVTINEAIEVVKKFSTAKSGSFVNGILDAVVLTLTKENRLSKKGRGLINFSSNPSRSPKRRPTRPATVKLSRALPDDAPKGTKPRMSRRPHPPESNEPSSTNDPS